VVSHSIEALLATEASPITDALALNALNISFNYLERAYKNGNDLEAREQMMYAGAMAAMAFNSAGLGYVHAIAHQLGGFYSQNHGEYNAVLLPYVFEFNATSVPEDRIRKIAGALGIEYKSKSHAVDKITSSINTLRKNLEIPSELKEMGLQKEDIGIIAENSLKDICCFTNPRQGNVEDISNILNSAL
jgi:alcohol dehydrogenase